MAETFEHPGGDDEGAGSDPAVISNDVELAIVREQIGRLESALESLRLSIGPKG